MTKRKYSEFDTGIVRSKKALCTIDPVELLTKELKAVRVQLHTVWKDKAQLEKEIEQLKYRIAVNESVEKACCTGLQYGEVF